MTKRQIELRTASINCGGAYGTKATEEAIKIRDFMISSNEFKAFVKRFEICTFEKETTSFGDLIIRIRYQKGEYDMDIKKEEVISINEFKESSRNLLQYYLNESVAQNEILKSQKLVFEHIIYLVEKGLKPENNSDIALNLIKELAKTTIQDQF